MKFAKPPGIPEAAFSVHFTRGLLTPATPRPSGPTLERRSGARSRVRSTARDEPCSNTHHHPQAPRKHRYLTWGGIGPVTHGAQPVDPDPSDGAEPIEVLTSQEVTIAEPCDLDLGGHR